MENAIITPEIRQIFASMVQVAQAKGSAVDCGSWKVDAQDIELRKRPHCRGIYTTGLITILGKNEVGRLISEKGVCIRSDLEVDTQVEAPYVEIYTRPKGVKLTIDAQILRFFTYFPQALSVNPECKIEVYGIQQVPSYLRAQTRNCEAVRLGLLPNTRATVEARGYNDWHAWALGLLPFEWAEAAFEGRVGFRDAQRALISAPEMFTDVHQQRAFSLRIQYRSVGELFYLGNGAADKLDKWWTIHGHLIKP